MGSIGSKRHRVAIQQQTTTPNSFNEPELTWAAIDCYKRLPAAVIGLTGQEAQFAGRTQATMTHRVEVRFLKSITPNAKLRVKWGDRILNVEGVIDGGEGREIEHHLMCVEVMDG